MKLFNIVYDQSFQRKSFNVYDIFVLKNKGSEKSLDEKKCIENLVDLKIYNPSGLLDLNKNDP